MENFLTEMVKIKEDHISDILGLKEKVDSLNQLIQKEQIKSKAFEEEYLQNSLNYEINTQENLDLEIKLTYSSNELAYTQSVFEKMTENLNSLKKDIKEKQEKQDTISKEIANLEEIILHISKNNKIIEEEMKNDYFIFDLKALALNSKKKPRNLQKKSFLDFISQKQNLEARAFKKNMKLSDLKLNHKNELLRLTGKISKINYSSDFYKSKIM